VKITGSIQPDPAQAEFPEDGCTISTLMIDDFGTCFETLSA